MYLALLLVPWGIRDQVLRVGRPLPRAHEPPSGGPRQTADPAELTMLIPFADVEPFLRAPGHPSVPVRACAASGSPHFTAFHPGQAVPRIFPVTNGQPVLIDFEQSVASPGWFTGAETYTFSMKRRRQWPRQLKGVLIGTAAISARNLKCFRDNLPNGPSPLVLMIGAATRGLGTEALYDDPSVRQIAFDIYPSPLTHFAADAHKIPLADACVDAVCVQAVLEHVRFRRRRPTISPTTIAMHAQTAPVMKAVLSMRRRSGSCGWEAAMSTEGPRSKV